MKKIFGRWDSRANFAPPEWRDANPDRAAVDDFAPIFARFEALDRCALRGSYVHRDLIWFVHLGTASAVLFAVLGALIQTGPEIAANPEADSSPQYSQLISALGAFIVKHPFSIIEILFLLAIVCLIRWVQSKRLQDLWTACRLAAEQLRIARMCLPVLVTPPAICVTDEAPTQEDEASVQSRLARLLAGKAPKAKDVEEMTFRAMSTVKRAVRDQGLPRGQDGFYLKVPSISFALRLDREIAVPVGWKDDPLRGRPGDWLLRYADGSHGVVQDGIFRASYGPAPDETRWPPPLQE